MEPVEKLSLISDNETSNAKLQGQLTQNRFDGLGKMEVWAYGVGHFINDLTAACWFNYLFFFLKKVVETDAASSALLAGQICDGIATPLVGIFSDKFNFKIGQRKPWYIGGLVLILACFIPLFSGYKNEDNVNSQYAFYTIFPGLFNVGWAALQISHMSLVPALTCSRKRRDKLNNLRNSFTFISNFAVLSIGLIIFSVMTSRDLEYKIISYFAIAAGLAASIFFLIKIDEPQLTKICAQRAQALKQQIAQQKSVDTSLIRAVSEFSTDSEGVANNSKNQKLQKKQSLLDWFKIPKFYLFGVCYMSVRLYTNIFGTLLPFYLIDVLKMGDDDTNKVSYNLALVPMIAYFTSVLMSTRLSWFYEKFGRKKALFAGTIICIICLITMLLITPQSSWVMYILALFIGCSQSLVLSTGINLISDVVGTKAKTGAFVFGAYSLLDKFSAGIVIFIIGNCESYSKSSQNILDSDVTFIRYTMVLIPLISCVLSSLIVLAYPIQQYGKQSKKKGLNLLERKSELQQELVS